MANRKILLLRFACSWLSAKAEKANPRMIWRVQPVTFFALPRIISRTELDGWSHCDALCKGPATHKRTFQRRGDREDENGNERRIPGDGCGADVHGRRRLGPRNRRRRRKRS